MTEFQKVNDDLGDLFENDKIKEIVEKLYTEDCCLMYPGMEAMKGREGAISCITSLKKTADKMKCTTIEVVPGGDDIATDHGCITLYAKGGEVLEEGKFVTLRKRVNGTWRFHYDIYNSNKA